MRFGRLGEEYSAPFDILDQGPHHRLRHYTAESTAKSAGVALLVPPLMVTADVYDIAPDVSATLALLTGGIDPWVVDFGAPERETGGMKRSLDDHVRAVVRAVGFVREYTGRDVHLCGYSQGGMFAYQTAAYLRSEGIRSVITFGSPVDLHKNLPAVRSDLTGALVRSLLPVTKTVLDRIEGLPGKVTSTAFKLVSTRKELEQRIEFLRMLHDRERIAKREARRRFLGGAGFVAWPGPAFRAFVEDFVVHNRMLSGGFVIDGRTVSLADLSCPILSFIGATDEIARPPTIRAIVDAAPAADVRFVTVRAGHFGIVVGSRAMETTWPTVATWIAQIEQGATAQTARLDAPGQNQEEHEQGDTDPADLDVEIDLFFDVAARAAKNTWRRVGDVFASASDTADAVRWQEPRLRRLARLEPDSRISVSRELATRARESPDATFFLWHGRAFSYRDADVRVTNVACGLYASGVRPGDRVGVVMESRPSLLSATTALARLGAIAVIAPSFAVITSAHARALGDAFQRLDVRRVIVDPEHAHTFGQSPVALEALVLGGVGGIDPKARAEKVAPSARVIDLESIDPSVVPLPSDFEVDRGRARDVSCILLRPSSDGTALRAVPVTNHRWALSAIGAAAACTIKPRDTVLCTLPLHHPTGILVSVGSALAGGARLALSAPHAIPLDAKELLLDIRRVGATVVFYTGEMLRPLLAEPVSRADRHLPVRIFAGSGMRPELAARLRERFGVDTMEFYAGTAHRAILADPSGDEPGALGGVLPGSARVALVRCDFKERTHVTDDQGHLVRASDDEPALLAVHISDDEDMWDGPSLVRDAFGDGSSWLLTSDVIKRDARGKHWFVDSLSGFVSLRNGGVVSTRAIEDVIYTLPDVAVAAAWEMGRGSGEVGVVYSRESKLEEAGDQVDERVLDALMTRLPPNERPALVARITDVPLTEGFRPEKRLLPEHAAAADAQWHYDAAPQTYVRGPRS